VGEHAKRFKPAGDSREAGKKLERGGTYPYQGRQPIQLRNKPSETRMSEIHFIIPTSGRNSWGDPRKIQLEGNL
jgi:hypothetical protein